MDVLRDYPRKTEVRCGGGVKAYHLREVPLRTANVEPRGSLLEGWSFWCAGAALEHAGPTGWPIRVSWAQNLCLIKQDYSTALPRDFLAADNAEAGRMLGIPEKLIPCLYARYDASLIVPKPEE
jgi:hypothetical protein